MGTLMISRDDSYFGSARRLVIYVDGVKVGKLRSDDAMSLELPNGKHTVRARMDWVTCRPRSVEVNDELIRRVEFSLRLHRLPLALLTPWWGYAAREV